jgi:hypothetical protein
MKCENCWNGGVIGVVKNPFWGWIIVQLILK